ncbi:diguanylate cyclase regulator RdcB family protein [Paraburkholderia tropica]|uniref:diguanylate cyclase regulator RdcB family protein n=1 Tax=Paraburkholderia tropica TaxID=92647 RepID=UPI003D27B35A
MSDTPIDAESAVCKTLTCLPEKLVVDFANCVSESSGRLAGQSGRNSFFTRCWEGFTGRSAERQWRLNQNFAEGLDLTLQWLTELTESVAQSNLAVGRVHDTVNRMMLDLADVADYSVSVKDELQASTSRLERRLDTLAGELARVDFIQRVQLNLDQVFNRWRAGRFAALSPAGRAYAALECLWWGAFGDYCRYQDGAERNAFVEDAMNRVTAQLAEDARCATSARLDTSWWLEAGSAAEQREGVAALSYLGDTLDPARSPVAFAVSQTPARLPLEMPLRATPRRISEALVRELFGEAGRG